MVGFGGCPAREIWQTQLAVRNEMVIVSRLAKGLNPRLLPEWAVSVMTSQPSLSMSARCLSIVCMLGSSLCR